MNTRYELKDVDKILNIDGFSVEINSGLKMF